MSSNIFITIMISSNFIFNFTKFCVIVSFLAELRALAILFSTAVRAVVVAKLITQKTFTLIKTFWRRLEDVFCLHLQKTSSRHFQYFLQRYFQDVFKTYDQVKLFLLTCLWEAFNKCLKGTPKTVIYRGICLGYTTSEKFMVSVKNLQARQKLLSISFSLYYTF